VSKASELLPEPETPVIATRRLRGMVRVDARQVVLARLADLDQAILHAGAGCGR
jgi:hypothetical protein